jgi:hypothetical protein
MSKATSKPDSTEYAPYFDRYIGKVPSGDIIDLLRQQLDSVAALIKGLDETRGNFRYAPGKWTIKELLGHVIDTERVFAYRALVFARNDSSELPGFEQEPWAEHANYAALSIDDIAAQFESVRRSTILLFQHLDDKAWDRKGVADGKNMTTRAAAFVIAGHTQHHLDILASRYR